MPVAALNVRPSRQKSLHSVRLDNRNRDVALNNIGERIILYAPADEPQHGYFGTATILDVSPDMKQRRFIFIALSDIALFGQFLPLEALITPIEKRAYLATGAIDFSYFSLGIRALTDEDQTAARALADQAWAGEERPHANSGLGMPATPPFSPGPEIWQRPGRLTREVIMRDRLT